METREDEHTTCNLPFCEKACGMPEPAVVTGKFARINCPEQDEYLYFHLKSGNHEFTMGMSDILQCLKFAQMEGDVPEIPRWWWGQMVSYYPKLGEAWDNDEIL